MNSDNREPRDTEKTDDKAVSLSKNRMDPAEVGALLRLLTTLGLTVCLGIVFFFSLVIS